MKVQIKETGEIKKLDCLECELWGDLTWSEDHHQWIKEPYWDGFFYLKNHHQWIKMCSQKIYELTTKYLEIVAWAKKRYTFDGYLIIQKGKNLSSYKKIESLAYNKYMTKQ